MRRDDFYQLLKAAIEGDSDALENILILYAPLINKYCYVDGIFDEDLRQYIWIHIALNISKFPLQK